MRPPSDIDRDVLTVLEIVQDAAGILSRVPLAALRAHLEATRPGPDSPSDAWFSRALNVTLAAQQLDAAQGILSAEEARHAKHAADDLLSAPLPDDWSAR